MYSLFVAGNVVETFTDATEAKEAFVEAILLDYKAVFVMDPQGHVICTNHN